MCLLSPFHCAVLLLSVSPSVSACQSPPYPQSSNAPSSMKASFIFSNHNNSFFLQTYKFPFSLYTIRTTLLLFVYSFWSFVHMSILPVDWVLGWQGHMLCHPYYLFFGHTWHKGKSPRRTCSWDKSVESNHFFWWQLHYLSLTQSMHQKKQISGLLMWSRSRQSMPSISLDTMISTVMGI